MFRKPGLPPRPDPSDSLGAAGARRRAQLLDVLATSADFRPAYDPLLRMALALGSVEPQPARALLGDLIARPPDRREAGEALRDLDR